MLPLAGHVFDAAGLAAGEVAEFGTVLFEVVEFPGFGVFADELPIAIADGLVAFVLPEEAAGGGWWLEEIEAFDGLGWFGVGEGAEGGEEIDDVGGGVFPGSGGDAAGPVEDEGACNTAFVGPVFEAAEGGVGDVGPVGGVALVGIFGAGHDGGEIAVADGAAVAGFFGHFARLLFRGGHVGGHLFGAAAVVGGEEDEGVFELALFAEGGDDAADGAVHTFDHGGEDGHAAGLPRLVGSVGPGGDFGGAGGGFERQAELFLFGDTGGADGVPAGGVALFVAGDIGFEGVERPVGGGEGGVEEEGLVAEGADGFDGFRGYGIGVVDILGRFGDVLFLSGEGGGLVVAADGGNCPVEAFEAAASGPVGAVAIGGREMPFAGHGGAVAGGAEGFGDGGTILAEVAAVAGAAVVIDHVADAGLVGVEAGHEGGAGGAAAGAVVELGVASAAGGEGIDIGGFDFRAVAADVGEAEIVGEEDDDIWTFSWGLGVGGEGRAEGEELPPVHGRDCISGSGGSGGCFGTEVGVTDVEFGFAGDAGFDGAFDAGGEGGAVEHAVGTGEIDLLQEDGGTFYEAADFADGEGVFIVDPEFAFEEAELFFARAEFKDVGLAAVEGFAALVFELVVFGRDGGVDGSFLVGEFHFAGHVLENDVVLHGAIAGEGFNDVTNFAEGGDDAAGEHGAFLFQAWEAGGEVHIHLQATHLWRLFVDRREVAGQNLLAELVGVIGWERLPENGNGESQEKQKRRTVQRIPRPRIRAFPL